ncbi:hypothetical protein CSIM01_12854 [Colletotrichum simmondsii]|uniref:Uncharacterized protein n=1 Tax=Colletotrichum simmondsii TaxID=703756 RepID=A0A135SFT3_9PEZI|nr:hypothetical protein CSIM01_12854 [Colletotrichum simmondsii]
MPFLKPAPRSANIRIERVAKVKVNVLKPVSSGVKKSPHVAKSSPAAKGKSSPKAPSKVDKVTKKTSTESIKAKSTEPKSPKAKTDPKTPKPKTKGKKPIDKASGDPAPIPSSTKTSNRVTKRTKKTKELPKGLVAIGSFGSAAATHRAQMGVGKSNIRLLPTALPVPLPPKKKEEGEVEGSAKGSAEPKKKKVTIATVGLTTPSPTPSRGSSVSRKQ